jgi:prolycopene isomerase
MDTVTVSHYIVPLLFRCCASVVPQGVNAVVFSGFGAAHRVAVDLGMEPGWPVVDKAYKGLLNYVRDRS